MAVTTNKAKSEGIIWRRFKDGESDKDYRSAQERIFQASWTHKCPEYVLSTPPCQGACPAGEDIRGYLNIARGIEKPPAGVTWQEYAFRRLTEANPFPAVMGRVCPAPCESVKQMADRVIDTTSCNVHQLKETVQRYFLSSGAGGKKLLVIQVTSFGYRFGVPPDADLVLDVRFLARSEEH